MVWDLLSALGGVGIFLVGMTLLTGALKGLAGSKMRAILARFTKTPLTGATTGALTTAVVQSSSATTVAAVGFVASGLLAFPAALGIIFGANIGTTITGWIVALLGFKLDLGAVVLPLIFVGAVLHLSPRSRLRLSGQAIVGFSLLFVGIDLMKAAMAGFEGVVTPADFPSDSVIGRLELVATGVLITVVTQSSSAGVATALAALGAGAISFPQAAALVIGMDVGTTFTALLATIGGGTMARRTGFAHVFYNFLTGLMAFFLLSPFAAMAAPFVAQGNGQIALVAFHSFFNALGVLLVLPLTTPFARLVEWLIPEKASSLTRSLDRSLLKEPDVALEATTTALVEMNSALCAHLQRVLGGSELAGRPTFDRDELETGVTTLRAYIGDVRWPSDRTDLAASATASLHALDHMYRLLYRCDQTERIAALGDSHRLRRLRRVLLGAAEQQGRVGSAPATAAMLDRVRQLLREQRKRPRDRIIEASIEGKISDESALVQLDALRWLHRVAYHLWRIRVHLNAIEAAPAEIRPLEEARLDVLED